jgi:transcriptional regulator with XRE-family HTH domain
MSTLSKRLKEARLQAKLSQEQLGLKIGLEPESASTRMNRYELGKRTPAFELVERIGVVLNFPVAYFYADNEDEAQLLVKFHRLSTTKRQEIISFIDKISA